MRGTLSFRGSNGDLPRAARAGQGRDRRGRRGRGARRAQDARALPRRARARRVGRGHIPGAVHIPRGHLESRIEGLVPDRGRELVVYCAGGTRSAFAAKTLGELGYEDVASLAGGFTDWKRNGFPIEMPRRRSTPDQRARYSRHLLIPEVGEEGQQKLLDVARAADRRRRARLARVALPRRGRRRHARHRRRRRRRRLEPAAPDRPLDRPARRAEGRVARSGRSRRSTRTSRSSPYEERLTSENVERILADGWDVIVDGADNFPTRYLVNDASVWHGIPVVHGSIYRFEGQVTVFKPGEGPCYRCLFPTPPPPELAPSCAEGGVLGVLPGIIGSLQANEALKLAARHRRHARGPAAALRRARDDVRRGRASSATRTARSAASTRRSPSTSTTSSSAPGRVTRVTTVRIPPTLRDEVGGEREVEARASTVREVLEDLAGALPRARGAALRGRRDRAVRERLRRRRGRAHARRPRHAGQRTAHVILLPAMAGGC